jgi:hypothetical protein
MAGQPASADQRGCGLAAAKARGVADVAFHKKCGIAITEMVKSPWVYRRLRNFRAGIETAISCFKRAYGAAPLHLARTGSLQGLHLVRRGGAQPGAVRPSQTGLAAPDCKAIKNGQIRPSSTARLPMPVQVVATIA